MSEPTAIHPTIAYYHGAWSELSLLSVALSSILAAKWATSTSPAGRSHPASDDWLKAYA